MPQRLTLGFIPVDLNIEVSSGPELQEAQITYFRGVLEAWRPVEG
jgi:hypothetical protein